MNAPPPTPPQTHTLLLGSYLDSVPNGGRFDGALGVLAALEALHTIKEAGLALPVDLEAIDFTDEEGTPVGELGSAALAAGGIGRQVTVCLYRAEEDLLHIKPAGHVSFHRINLLAPISRAARR